MLQTTEKSWTSSGQGYADLEVDDNLSRSMDAAKNAIAVSSRNATALVESQTDPQAVAMTLQVPSSSTGSQTTTSAMSGLDTAVLAMAFVGAWMIVVGWAMLARRMRVAKTSMFGNAQTS